MEGKLGYELELVWKRDKRDDLKELLHKLGFNYGGDISIQDRGVDNAWNQEIKSKVYDLSDKEQIFKDYKKLQKYFRECNDSMGLHIHISFPKYKNYSDLLSWEFVKNFQDNYLKTFTTRVEKERANNKFCRFYSGKKDFEVDSGDQVKSKKKDNKRRRSVNFNSYNLYKTIEFRIFPATDKLSKFKKYVNFVYDQIESHLEKSKDETVVTAEKVGRINSLNEDIELSRKERIIL